MHVVNDGDDDNDWASSALGTCDHCDNKCDGFEGIGKPRERVDERGLTRCWKMPTVSPGGTCQARSDGGARAPFCFPHPVSNKVLTFIFLLLQRAHASCERLRRRGSAGDDGSPFSFFLRFRDGGTGVGVAGGGIISC